MSKKGTPSKGTPTKGKGVGYFNHFPKNFLHPYGHADEPPSVETIFPHTNPMNCEMLTRPSLHFSELSETINDNLPIHTESAIVSKKVNSSLASLKELGEKLSVITLKDDEEQPSKEDRQRMMPAITEHTHHEEFMVSAFKVGGALFSIGCSYLVTQAHLRYSGTLAEKLSMSLGEDKTFKASQTLTSFRDLLLAGHKRPHHSSSVSSCRNLNDLLGQLSSDDEDEPPKKKSKKVAYKKASVSSDDDSA